VAPVGADAHGTTSDAGWSGASTGIGGTGRYDGGEWVYQDFVYDDGGRGNNTADVVQVRVRESPSSPGESADLEIEVTINSLLDASSTVIGVALSGPDDVVRPWPFGATSGVDELGDFVAVASRWHRFVTVAEGHVWESLDDGEPVGTGDAAVDLVANTITFGAATSEMAEGEIALNIGAGVWDASTRTWSDGGVLDLAFNRHELEPVPLDFPFSNERVFRDQQQQMAIDAGDVSRFDHALDRGRLRTEQVGPSTTGGELMGEAEQPPPSAAVAVPSWLPKMAPSYPGQKRDVVNRVYRSIQDLPEGYGPPGGGEALGGNAPHPMGGLYQTYRITIPPGYDGSETRPLNLLLHAMGGNHNSNPAHSVTDRLGADLGAFTVAPLALGPAGWYANEALVDTLQALADVEQHYAIDRDRISVAGYSMGGGGVYRLATLLPDLFASGVVWVGYTNRPAIDQIENAQHVPLMIIHGTNDETVPLHRVTPYTDRLRELGYDHRLNVHPGFDHFALWLTDEWTRERDWVGAHRRTVDPGNVRMKVRPSAWADGPRAAAIVADLRKVTAMVGTSIDGAYWVSSVAIDGEGDASGVVDLTSSGISPRVPVASEILGAEPGPPTPYVQQGIARRFEPAPTSNTLTGTLSGIRELTVDLERARLDLNDLRLDVNADRDVTLHLRDGTGIHTVTIAGASGDVLSALRSTS
jgi:poly(3-hydroxybutyrate) depolymerase